MDIYKPNDFVFSSRYRIVRHLVFWLAHILLGSFVWLGLGYSMSRHLFHGALWVPVLILYCYPLMYLVLPQYLLKGKYVQFILIILFWGIAGWFLNFLFRAYIFIPIQEYMGFDAIVKSPWQPGSFLLMSTTAGITSIIVLFKYWVKKQQEWLHAQNEKITAELQLLKAQVHPHFLFNTLNNIYSFSLENSPKTPELILKLSSLLSYMLYDCKAEEVLLEKEIEVMKDYIDLEKERYGNNIEISLNIEGDLKDKYVAPLLLLPFLENAFKHGTSEQLEKPWLSLDLVVKHNTMRCKVVNSKNEFVAVSENGIGIQNVKKRLMFLYPNKHEVKITDEKDFFVVFLSVELTNNRANHSTSSFTPVPVAEKAWL
jgi:hypothetical protein